MQQSFNGSTSIVIGVPAERVWDALTDPRLMEKWLHGTEVETDWKINSPIIYRGTWEGKSYVDKGTVIEVDKPKRLRATFWSSLSGKEDKPENYEVVSYELEEKGKKTQLILTQSNCKTQEEADLSAKNWATVLKDLQALLEK
jgi:uncharacterized protein YndB with AHSA1/START domain